MRWIVLLFALAMPAIAWLSNAGHFGPTNGEMSDRYPTLLVAAGYAFAIWGLIFLLDAAWAIWQLRERGDAVRRARLPAALGFALTAAWMPVFSQAWFGLALAIIWGALAAVFYAAWTLARDEAAAHRRGLAAAPLALHAGWLSLAVFLNTAQVVTAYGWLPAMAPIEWSAMLFGLCGVLLLAGNRALRGHLAYAAAGLWGLAAVVIEQSGSGQDGADTAARIALALAVLLLLQTAWLAWTHHRRG